MSDSLSLIILRLSVIFNILTETENL